jgi:AcrR family transcriptional regulator
MVSGSARNDLRSTVSHDHFLLAQEGGFRMSPRKAVALELSRERILDEARELFAKYGYHRLTMRTIAHEMGYSHGALYYHFRDKAELFHDLIREDFRLLIGMQRELLKDMKVGDSALLKRMMLTFIEFGLDHPHHYEMMFFVNEPELKQYSRTEQALCLDLFAEIVYGVISQKPESAHKRYTLPWYLFMSLHGFITMNIHYGQTYKEVKNLAGEHVAHLCRGIS